VSKTSPDNKPEFDKLVKRSHLTLAELSPIIKRKPQTVRAYACGLRHVPYVVIKDLTAYVRSAD
jgi:hypothetical protein